MKMVPAPEIRSLIERKQETVRDGVFEHAVQLFLLKGYQETTIDDIARAAGIGRRTFFRYFKTKDDVVLWKFDHFARDVATRISEQPAGEAPIVAVSRALLAASDFYNQNPAQTLALLEMTMATPSLYAQQLMQGERWKCWFADALRVRMRTSAGSLMPDLVAAVGLEVFAMAVRRWVAEPGESLRSHARKAFGSLRKIAL